MNGPAWNVLLHVLRDGRWHQLSSVAAYRLATQHAEFEVQMRPPLRPWTAAHQEYIGARPRTLYRARLRREHVRPLPNWMLTPSQRKGLDAIQAEMSTYADVKDTEGPEGQLEARDIRAALDWLRTV